MFYSHTFLARKSPLGIVWCAAHLHRKLNKSHYISINILSTVERIMYPELPIALRMSAHLLLGVVRIFSKQVHYLYEDCNVVQITINKAPTAVNVNLPEDASHAPFHSVTLPEKFELDALELDDYSWCENDHLKSYDDITLTEQIPTGKDPYIVITFDEDSLRDKSYVGTMPMEEDVPTPVQEDAATGFKDQSSSKQQGFDEGIAQESSPPDLPSLEIQRNANHGLMEENMLDANHGFDFNNSPLLPDRADPDIYLEEQINKEKTVSPQVPSPQKHQEPHSNDHSEPQTHFDDPMPEIRATPMPEIRATPPNAQPNVRRRKRKQLFDASTVLSNRYMRNSLNDTSNIRRVKKNCPCSSLDIWKLKNRIRKDGALFEPLITGLCAELGDTCEEGFISRKPHLVAPEEAHGEAIVNPSPQTMHDNDVEIEVHRNNEYNLTDGFVPSSSTPMPFPSGRNDLTPDRTNFELRSERAETTEGAGTLPTPDIGASTGTSYSDMETPPMFNGEGLHAEHTALSDIPELETSAGELGFLEQDDNSPAGSQGTPEVGILSRNQRTPKSDTLSSRTRALAQYLKRQVSVTPVSGNSESGDLSLLKILEGKPRKICARMFSETLALKNYGLVDVRQDEPYGDITLKVTPKLFKKEFSG